MASPVRGLRPGRGALRRMLKLPKPDILTSSPSSRVLWMRSKKASTMSFDSRLLSPRRSNSSSASSALVSVGVTRVGCRLRGAGESGRVAMGRSAPLGPKANAEPGLERGKHAGDDALDALVGQRLGIVAQLEAQCQAPLVGGDAGHRRLRLVDVEQGRGAQDAAGGRRD